MHKKGGISWTVEEILSFRRFLTFFNKKVAVGADNSPLKKSITLSDYLELKSTQNSFSFRVVAVGFNSPSYFSGCFKKQSGVFPRDFI